MNKGLDDDVNFFKVPEDWTPLQPKVEKGEPPFKEVDNPGKWPEYSFRTNARGPYEYHRLPSGVTPVPKNGDGKREVEGWNFHYDGWIGNSRFCSGANCSNPFPKERRGRLDYELLKKWDSLKKE